MSLQYADNNLCSSSAVFQVSCKVSQQEDGSGVLCNIKNIILFKHYEDASRHFNQVNINS